MKGMTSNEAVTSVLPSMVTMRLVSALPVSQVRKLVTGLGTTVSVTSVPASYFPLTGSGESVTSPHLAPSPLLFTVRV